MYLTSSEIIDINGLENAIQHRIFEAMPFFIYTKNRDGQYLYANRNVLQESGLKRIDRIQGFDDIELNFDGNIEHWIQHDIETHAGECYYQLDNLKTASDNKYTLLSYKQKVLNTTADNSIIICYTQPIKLPNFYILNQSGFTGVDMEKRIKLVDEQEYSRLINVSEKLTSKESEVLFYLLHGKKIKQIADLMLRSPRTVESHINRIKDKWQCNYINDILDKAYNYGLFNVIPKVIFDRIVRK